MNGRNVPSLIEYAKEIGVEEISVSELIDSHRRLRETNKQYRSDYTEAVDSAREAGYAYGVAQATTDSIRKKIRGMTLLELVEYIKESDE